MHGWISPAKNQGNVGACWAFAVYATLEAQLLKAGKGEWDLSEKNMVNLHGWSVGPNDGGNNDVAAAYLLRWGGAVAESNDVYKSSMSAWTSSPLLSPAVRVQHVVWTDPIDGSQESSDALKEAIMGYGAVATSMYFNDNFVRNESHYYFGEKDPNHAVAIVGWDDEYPTNNFKNFPPGPGAWIMKNSWGKSVGSNGFYFFTVPTPGADNSGGLRRVAESPVLLSEEGVFNGVESVEVVLSADGEIRYTTDGSVPTRASALYEGPFTVSSTGLMVAITREAME